MISYFFLNFLNEMLMYAFDFHCPGILVLVNKKFKYVDIQISSCGN